MSISNSDIKRAAALLKEGKLVSFPTETVYGLGADATSDAAVAKIYAAKARPDFNPLIVHVGSLEDAAHHVLFNARAEKLAHAFWPGPLTLVLPRKHNCQLSLLVSAGMDTVAVRMPTHEIAQALLHEAAIPIAAPSANRSGRLSPTEAEHVREELGDRVDMILDGGPCHLGIESTVVDMTGEWPVILRPGTISGRQLAETLGCHPAFIAGSGSQEQMREQVRHDNIKSPGMLASHYAPSKPLRLNASDIKSNEALLAFGKNFPGGAVATQNLSVNGNLQEAAANLFSMLRILDSSAATSIAVMSIPENDADNALGIAINDRLKRAATK